MGRAEDPDIARFYAVCGWPMVKARHHNNERHHIMDQNKGNFLVTADRKVIKDTNDWPALLSGSDYKKKPWDFLGADILYMACYWEVDGRVKGCLTDRETNSLEIADRTIEELVETMDRVTGRK